MEKEKIGAVIVAGGKGSRMNSSISKQFIQLKDKEILAWTVEKFEDNPQISQIVVVIAKEYIEFVSELSKKYKWKKTLITEGGQERFNSVYNGLMALDKETKLVLIHDGVRPFVTQKNIDDVVEQTQKSGACILAVKVKDTIKVCKDNMVEDTPDRSLLWSVQTPQGFDYREVLKGYNDAKEGVMWSDDAMLMESLGYKIHVVEGSYCNIKITTPEDLLFAEMLIGGEKTHENS